MRVMLSVGAAASPSIACLNTDLVCFALILVGCSIGTATEIRCGIRTRLRLFAHSVGRLFKVQETPTGSIAPGSALIAQSGKGQPKMDDYKTALIAYRTSMAVAAGMLYEGIITEKDYGKIDRIMAKKYGLSLGSICCRKPLIAPADRGNMRHNEGSDTDGPDDY